MRDTVTIFNQFSQSRYPPRDPYSPSPNEAYLRRSGWYVGADIDSDSAMKIANKMIGDYTGSKKYVFIQVPKDSINPPNLIDSDKKESMLKFMDQAREPVDPGAEIAYAAYWDATVNRKTPLLATMGKGLEIKVNPLDPAGIFTATPKAQTTPFLEAPVFQSPIQQAQTETKGGSGAGIAAAAMGGLLLMAVAKGKKR